MKNATGLSIPDVGNILGAVVTDYPVSNTSHLRKALLAKDSGGTATEKAYRDLFKQMEASASIDHDSSIFSPAAYLADLLRTVHHMDPTEEIENKDLFMRRPDLLRIPLDAENTTKEVPYLEIVNEVLAQTLAHLDPKTTAADKHFATATFPLPLPHNEPLTRIRQYLKHFKTDLAEVFAIYGKDEARHAAEVLELGEAGYRQIVDPKESVKAIRKLRTGTTGTATTDIGHLLPMIGVSTSHMDAVLGVKFTKTGKVRATQPSPKKSFVNRLITSGMKAAKSDDTDVEYFIKKTDDSHQLMVMRGTSAPAPVGMDTKDEKLAHDTALGAIVRITRLLDKLDWSSADLNFVIDDDDLDVDSFSGLARIRQLQSRLKLSAVEFFSLFVPLHTIDAGSSVEPSSFFNQVFPWPWKDPRYKDFTLGTIPTWLTGALKSSDSDLQDIVNHALKHEVFDVREDEVPSEDEAVSAEETKPTPPVRILANAKNLSEIYRRVRLSALLKRPVFELLRLADLLDSDLGDLDDVEELVDYSDWAATSGIAFGKLSAMAGGTDVDHCDPGHIRQLNKIVVEAVTHAGLKKADTTHSGNSADDDAEINSDPENTDTDHSGIPAEDATNSDADALHAVVCRALAQFYQVDDDVLLQLINGGEIKDLLDKLADGVFVNAKVGDIRAIPCLKVLCSLESTLLMVKTFQFSAQALHTLGVASVFLGMDDTSNEGINLPNVRALHAYVMFNKATGTDYGADLLELIPEGATGDDLDSEGRQQLVLEKYEKWTGLTKDYLTRFLKRDAAATDAEIDDEDAFNWLKKVRELRSRAELASRLGVSVDMLTGLAQIYDFDTAVCPPADVDKNWQAQLGLADQLTAAVSAKFSDAAWSSAQSSLTAQAIEQKRDTLAQALLRVLSASNDDALTGGRNVERLSHLSDVLLIDVEMGGDATISRVKEGLNAVQRYIQQCQTDKDAAVTFSIDEREWTWRKHYRIWEGNRKVFLYPENLLDPGLRRQKTPIFKQLEDQLLQGEINNDTATRAYIDYFDKLEVLATLDTISSCAAVVEYGGTGTGDKTIFFIGKDKNDPPSYYFRSALFDDDGSLLQWRPWQKIDLTIHVDRVGCVYVNHRLHIFWVEEKKTTEQVDHTKTTTTTATVKFSYHTVAGDWLPPQVHGDFKDVPVCETVVDISKKDPAKSTPKLSPRPVGFPAVEPSVNIVLALDDTDPKNLHARVDAKWFKVDNVAPTEQVKQAPAPKAPWIYHYGWSKTDTGIPASHAYHRVGEITVSDILLGPDGLTLFAARTSQHQKKHLFRSTDGGRSWHPSQNGLVTSGINKGAAARSIRKLFRGNDERTIYAATGSGNLLFKSVDNGGNWKSVPRPGHKYGNNEPSDAVSELIIHPNGKNYFAIAQQRHKSPALHRSENSGQSWTECTAGLPRNKVKWLDRFYYPPITALCFGLDQKTVLTGIGTFWGKDRPDLFSHGVYRSSNNGRNWQLSNKGWEDGSVDILLPIKGGREIIGISGDRVFLSIDDGKSWKLQTKPPASQKNKHQSAADYNKLREKEIQGFEKIIEAADGSLVAWTNLGLMRSTDSGKTWTPVDLPDDVKTKSISAISSVPDGNGLMIGTKTQGIYSLQLETSHMIEPDVNVRARHRALTINSGGTKREHRLNSTAMHGLSGILISAGLDRMLSLETQSKPLEYKASDNEAGQIDFKVTGAYAAYYSEVFFHIPYLIADTLNRNKAFEDAQKWYHHIFCPNRADERMGKGVTAMTTTAQGGSMAADDPTVFWRYRPFKNYNLVSMQDLANSKSDVFRIYANDPYDAHAIAGIRMGAYEKAVVMRYIDNLLDWGDQLFSQDSWEYIMEAMTHYRLAYELLRPEDLVTANAKAVQPKSMNFSDFIKKYGHPENLSDTFHIHDLEQFPAPRNDRFAGYGRLVKKRILEIRSSENIKGIKRHLALFSPPVDPRRVMQAMAAGQSLTQATSPSSGDTPKHRFVTMIRRAKELAGTVSQLGNALLSALEKKDAEILGQLRATHENQTLAMSTQIKQLERDEAGVRLKSLGASLENAQARQTHYQGLITAGLLSSESTSLELKEVARGFQDASSALRIVSAAGYLMPNIFGLADGGSNFGRAIELGATVSEGVSSMLNQEAGLAEVRAMNERRQQDWQLQADLASKDIAQLEAEIEAAKIQGKLSEEALEQHQKTIEQSAEVEAYLKNKFTNKELFAWTIGRLSSVYFQTYQMALTLAQEAQDAFLYERLGENPILSQGMFHSLRSGLLAGEDLMLSLNRLEFAFYKSDRRDLEIEKTISLNQIAPEWRSGLESGKISFPLTAELFDQDFKDHWFRRIKSIAISLPAVVGPYQNVHATLNQTTSRLHASADATDLTSNLMPFRQVAISRGVNDSGVFELNFNDDKYQPFEGTGAISDWDLILPQKSNAEIHETLSDVIIHLRYTARDGATRDI